jgi:hypothetical protein
MTKLLSSAWITLWVCGLDHGRLRCCRTPAPLEAQPYRRMTSTMPSIRNTNSVPGSGPSTITSTRRMAMTATIVVERIANPAKIRRLEMRQNNPMMTGAHFALLSNQATSRAKVFSGHCGSTFAALSAAVHLSRSESWNLFKSLRGTDSGSHPMFARNFFVSSD